MSGDVQLELWLSEYKMDALSSVLEEQGTTVEERMQEMLIDLYTKSRRNRREPSERGDMRTKEE